MSRGLAATWSMFGTYCLIAYLAVITGGFAVAGSELPRFLFGGALDIEGAPSSFLMMVPVILAILAIDLPCVIGAGMLQGFLLGQRGNHAVEDMLERTKEGHWFVNFFLLVLAEELFARWFFLGVLTGIPGLDGTFGFYLLFFLGNALWALMHLGNYEDERDKHWLRVLPQFVSGVFFTYVYVKYGLLGAVLAHFAANALLFASHKMQDADFADILVIVVSAGLTFGSYALMKKPLTDVLPWFSDEPVFVLEGWGFWDYLKFSVFVTGIFALVLEVLCYDRTAVDRSEKKKNDGPDTLLGACVGFVVGLLLIIGVIYGLYSLIGLFVSSVPYRIVILAILFAFLQKGESGSAMARTFWTALPNVYIGLCILQALDLQWAILLLIVEMIIVLPLTVLRHFQH